LTVNNLCVTCRCNSLRFAAVSRRTDWWRMAAARGSRDALLCADWLLRCQVLSRDQRAAQPTATISDLNHSLRDGVLICLLINRLRPKTIDPKDFSQRPQMSQVCNCYTNVTIMLLFNKNNSPMSQWNDSTFSRAKVKRSQIRLPAIPLSGHIVHTHVLCHQECDLVLT